jgi:thiopeptide-type bacteriocin biosynthesis protein
MPWLSIHFYPDESQDVFLSRALKPFLEQYVWPQKTTRAFFIRYQDEKGPHIRIRIRGEQEWLEDPILPAFEGWFAGRGTWEQVRYEPETERFGGEEGLAWAEEYFHVSTRVALDRIARDQFTYGDAMFDALRLHCIAVFGAGMNKSRAQWYFTELYKQWLPLFFGAEDAAMTAEIVTSFDQTFAAQKASLSGTLDAFWTAMEAEKMDAVQQEWLRWLRGNQLILAGFENNLEKALPSLLHLTNNRMGINNQDEVYLNYILSQSLVAEK